MNRKKSATKSNLKVFEFVGRGERDLPMAIMGLPMAIPESGSSNKNEFVAALLIFLLSIAFEGKPSTLSQ